MRRASVLLIAALLSVGSTLVQAQWKWRDKAGQVHASDLPPPRDIEDKDVLQRPAAPAARAAPSVPAPSAPATPSADAKPRLDPELEARRKQAEADQAAQRKQDEDKQQATRSANCDRARTQLRSLESGLRLARVNEKGDREIMDDKARAEEIQRARNIAASDCR